MKIEEMKRIAAHKYFGDDELPGLRYEFVLMVEENWDKLMAVVEAARKLNAEGVVDDGGVLSGFCYGYGQLQEALEALESEE